MSDSSPTPEDEALHPAVQRARELRARAGLPASLVATDVLSRILAVLAQSDPGRQRRGSAA